MHLELNKFIKELDIIYHKGSRWGEKRNRNGEVIEYPKLDPEILKRMIKSEIDVMEKKEEDKIYLSLLINFDCKILFLPEIVFPGEEVNLLLNIIPVPLISDLASYFCGPGTLLSKIIKNIKKIY